MAELRCKSCGAVMTRLHDSNEAVCEYCNSREVIVAADQRTLHKFKSMFQTFIHEIDESGEKSKVIRERIKEEREEPASTTLEEVYTEEGQTVEIHYLYKDMQGAVVTYVTRENVIFRFSRGQAQMADCYKHNAESIKYPSEEMRRVLHAYLPEIVADICLEAGERMLVIKKLAKSYPLELLLPLEPCHAAWVISRLENLICLLKYNGISLGRINMKDLMINPENHQVLLYGGWWNGESRLVFNREMKAVRQIVLQALAEQRKVPPAMRTFLESREKDTPEKDFTYWDVCLEQAFGERKFVPWKVTEREIYE